MYRIATLVGIVTTLMVSEASADHIVSCKNKKGQANSTLISYAIKETDSRRLGSDISLRIRNQDSTVSSLSIAQYLAQRNVLFLMIDDSSENRILEFKATVDCHWRRGKFHGTIREITNGHIIHETKVDCTITET